MNQAGPCGTKIKNPIGRDVKNWHDGFLSVNLAHGSLASNVVILFIQTFRVWRARFAKHRDYTLVIRKHQIWSSVFKYMKIYEDVRRYMGNAIETVPSTLIELAWNQGGVCERTEWNQSQSTLPMKWTRLLQHVSYLLSCQCSHKSIPKTASQTLFPTGSCHLIYVRTRQECWY